MIISHKASDPISLQIPHEILYSNVANKRHVTLIKIAFFAENGRLFQLPRLVNFQNFPNLPIIADKKKCEN